MEEECKPRRHWHKGGHFSWGPPWIMGWLFTIGFAHLTFWKGVIAIIIWPYFIGTLIR